MTAFTITWNSAFEAVPANGDDASEGALRVRQLKNSISERFEVDHSYAGDVDDGAHKKITFVDPLGAKPTQANDESYLYTKDVSATSELFFEDEAGNEVQLTSAGSSTGDIFASADEILWRGATVPSGYSVQAYDDELIRIISSATSSYPSGGSNAASVKLNASVTSGNQNANHGHTFSDSYTIPNESPALVAASGGAFNLADRVVSISGTTGNQNANHGHATNLNIKYRSFNVIRKA